jgi:hypothetical protein
LEIFSECGGAGGIAEESSKVKGKKRKPAPESNVALKDFTVEYAKSSRSTCRGCEEKIMKVSAFMGLHFRFVCMFGVGG